MAGLFLLLQEAVENSIIFPSSFCLKIKPKPAHRNHSETTHFTMSGRASGNSTAKKQVSFSSDVKKGSSTKPPRDLKKGVLAKKPSDMTAFERIAYVNSLDFEKEEAKEREDVNEDVDDGKLTKDVAKKFLAVHAPVSLKKVHYKLQVDPSKRFHHDEEQTNILKEEVTSSSPDLMRVVQCLERGGCLGSNRLSLLLN